MAYRRSLAKSARLVLRQRFSPSVCYNNNILHSDEKLTVKTSFRSFGNNSTTTWLGFGGGGRMSSFREYPKGSHNEFLHSTSGLMLFARNMSTTVNAQGKVEGEVGVEVEGEGEEKIGFMADLADKIMEVVSSHATPQVVAAAADSCLPVAVVQHAIDGIHLYTGHNWWASIAITTLVIRTLTLRTMIRAVKGKELSYMAPGMYSRCVCLIPVLKDLFIRGTVVVSFYLAIQNMVEKVPSFQTVGAYWFIDLTATDSSYILPCLAAFSFWCPTMLSAGSGLLILVLPTALLAADFPNALLCSWIASNLFSFVYRLIIFPMILLPRD